MVYAPTINSLGTITKPMLLSPQTVILPDTDRQGVYCDKAVTIYCDKERA